jgi:hypothetical protein
VRVEPLHAVGPACPLGVEECLDPGHAVALPGLHLGGRPVDGVDLGSGADAAEKVVARAPVGLEELVGFDVADDVAVPAECLVAVEVTADYEAAALPKPGELIRCHRAGGDVGVVDDRPYGFATGFLGGDLLDSRADALLDDGEHVLDGPAGGRDAGP